MELSEILFFVLAGLTLLSGLMTVLTKNPMHSILYLIITFFSISSHYVLLNAQFLAVVNIIVYAGAIMVLFLFVVMLMNLNKEDTSFGNSFKILAGLIAASLFFILTVGIFFQSDITSDDRLLTTTGEIGLVENLGVALFSDYVVPFELASILFMGSMIGAVMLSKRTHDLKVKD